MNRWIKFVIAGLAANLCLLGYLVLNQIQIPEKNVPKVEIVEARKDVELKIELPKVKEKSGCKTCKKSAARKVIEGDSL